jgi:hypothetical protein
MKPIDYLTMRTPEARLGDQPSAEPGTVPKGRVILSLIGLMLGIVASFFVTGLTTQTKAKGSPAADSTQQTAATSTQPPPSPPQPIVRSSTWREFFTVCLIAAVICGLTYQGLYFSLRLYEGQPTFLILFVSFQYGYFWQSVVNALTP